MKKLHLLKMVFLLCALVVGSSAWADNSFTITFAASGSGDGSALSTSTACSSIVTSGSATYLSGDLVAATNAYGSGSSGLKLGKSGNAGTIKMNLSALYSATTIKVNAKRYNTSKTVSLSVNGGTSQAVTNSADFNDYTFTVNSNISYLELQASQYCWISSVTVNYTSSTPLPSISADAVNLAYDITNGSIAYTISNPWSPAGTLTAAITAGNEGSWLTLGEVGNTSVALTCSANPTNAVRSATVTLTYTYNTNQTVTKNVTVTQAANPNVFDNISSITAASTAYQVKGTVVATSAKGLVIGDGTGYVYYYKDAAVTQSVGNNITISGTTGSYGHVLQFTNAATVDVAATSNYDYTPAVTVVDADAIATYNANLHLSDYVQFQGALAKNSSNYDITVGTATARISYPTDAQKTALDALVSKTVSVKGYFTGFSSSYFTVMLESAEEVAVPTITATPSSRSGFFYMPGNGPSAAKTISVAGSNLTANISLTASTNYEMCLTQNGDYTNSLTLTQTAGAVAATTVYVRLKAGLTSNDYDGTITLTSTGADNVVVNLSGSVPALASLPFSWTGGNNTPNNAGETELAAQTGVEVYLGGGFAASNAPYRLKFDGTTKYVVIYTDEKPEAVAFTAKIFNATTTDAGSKIKVQGSADGITFNDIQEFTIKGEANATFQFTTTEAFAANHRAVKLIMSAKDQNVGVGTITITARPEPTAPVVDDVNHTVTLTTTTNMSGWRTFSPSKADQCYTANADVYYASASTPTTITLTKIDAGVPANTPVILHQTSGTSITLTETATNITLPGSNLLAVSTTNQNLGKVFRLGYKTSNGVGFYTYTSLSAPAGIVYVNIPSSAREFLGFDFGDDTTGVNEVKSQKLDAVGEYFNLAGQRVAQPTKGLYIVNGKKIVIK